MFPFQVDESSDVPLWVQLRNRVAYLITSGYFKPGDQLPTVRGLASDISINYNTVNKAYLSLVSDGYLESTRGRGVFVRDLAADIDQEATQKVGAILDDCVAACRDLGMDLDDIQKCMTAKILQVKQAEGLVQPDAEDGATEPSRGRIITIAIKPGRAARFGTDEARAQAAGA
ncbi:GntR family transcriptional regulator [Adlercreutzia aquisgranensis]|uniref:GntR family transcriptional regulator n=1 Tax=Adlercreutzia aquisgranensis TaxID=2941323 RepID=UPI00203CCE94|nr:GntR family transcriptional regulator [Adlercreutzia aquisgranensis]